MAISDDPVLLDVSRLLWRRWLKRLPTGIDRAALAYVDHWRGKACAVIQRGWSTTILSHAASAPLFELLLNDPADFRASLPRLLPRAVFRPRNFDVKGRLYFNIGHTGLDKPGHARWVKRTGVRAVYFVHDLIPLTHPEYCRPAEPEKHLRRMTTVLAHGAGVIGNSQDTLNQLAAFAASRAHLAMPPALVAPLGVPPPASETTDIARTSPSARPYFVMLGTIEGRKNHLLILTLWAEMARRLGSACAQLVIIGRRGWECEQAVDMLERCRALQGHVTELQSCDDAQLHGYLKHARALLFPSFVEGYGLPLVEALAHGTPVIASDLRVFRELAGDIPDYLSPIDGLAWMRAIEAYTAVGSPQRDAQMVRMSGWQPPTWDAHFSAVEQWLDQFS